MVCGVMMDDERSALRGLGVLLVLLLGFLSGMGWRAVRRADRDVARLSLSLSAPADLRPGEPARYQGRLAPAAKELRSRDQGVPCVAYRTRVTAITEISEEHDRRDVILDERRGPPYLLVRGDRGHVAVALDKWVSFERARSRHQKHRPLWGVTFSQPSTARGVDSYMIEEQTLVAGEPLFVAGAAGRLWDAAAPETDTPARSARAPVRELLEDPARGRVEIFHGEQRDQIARLRGDRRWPMIGAVAAAIPALFVLVFLVISWIRD
jgi:hypothetical protein